MVSATEPRADEVQRSAKSPCSSRRVAFVHVLAGFLKADPNGVAGHALVVVENIRQCPREVLGLDLHAVQVSGPEGDTRDVVERISHHREIPVENAGDPPLVREHVVRAEVAVYQPAVLGFGPPCRAERPTLGAG